MHEFTDEQLAAHDREVAARALARLQEMRGGDIEQEYIDAILAALWSGTEGNGK